MAKPYSWPPEPHRSSVRKVDETFDVTYEGGPVGAHLFVGALEADGASVTWTPPIEERGAGVEAAKVVVQIAVACTPVVLDRTLEKFRQRAKITYQPRHKD